MNQDFETMNCDESLLQALFSGAQWVNALAKKTGKNKRSIINHLRYLQKNGLVASQKVGKKMIFELTEKGKDACVYYQIKKEAGYVGLEWAKEKFEKGYRVRFLSDLTGLLQHKRWLFAWHPFKGEFDLAQIFGVKTVKNNAGSPAYVAQYLDREVDPSKPIRQSELFEFVKNNVKDFGNEQEIAGALKQFWDPNMHNSFLCVLLPPEDVNFGFPHEIGNFGSMVFVGFGYQKHFPFIPKMNFAAGVLGLSKNFAVEINYETNLILQHTLIWLLLKRMLDPPSKEAEKNSLEKTIQELESKLFAEILRVKIGCKHCSQGFCKKMEIPCVAEENGKIDLKKCPVLMDEVRKVFAT